MNAAADRGFRSLHFRLLFPLLAVALVASVAVAWGSYLIGDRWARIQALATYRGIESTLSPASYLLTQTVVDSVADLTETELLAVNSDGILVQASLDLNGGARILDVVEPTTELRSIGLNDRIYQFRTFARRSRPDEGDLRVVVLFDEAQLQSTRLRAATLPLITGLSTIVLLTSVTYVMTARMLRRLAKLQSQVDQIAEGNFAVQVPADTSDEIGLLGRAVTRMSGQLESMWQTLNRQQGQKLLHQVAGGLAHQLRNSITGARMAVELHQRSCDADDASLAVALSQLEQTENHVRRLLLVASGKQEQDQPQRINDCLSDIRSAIDGTASHLRADLNWDVASTLDACVVSDGPTLHAAVTNLAINALEEATKVDISATLIDSDRLQIQVSDNGNGPPLEVADDLFEPFVTSKPEGLGLGLPLVMRAAQRLGGKVEWTRSNDKTLFTLVVPVSVEAPSVPRITQHE